MEYAVIIGFAAFVLLLIFGKRILKSRVFQSSIFQQAKWLISTPIRSFKVLFVSETGDIGIALMPLSTGFVLQVALQRAWRMVHDLTIKMPGVDGKLLPITERSYTPLDPHGKLTVEETKQLAEQTEFDAKDKTVKLGELDSIAAREHDKAVMTLRSSWAKRQAAAMFKLAIVVSGIIIVLILIVYTVKK